MAILTREKTNGKIKMIKQSKIIPNPAQPRTTFSPEELAGLAESIRENGILQPLTVRRNILNEYELISGERRLRAAKLIGMERVPCVLIETTPQQSAVFAILENIQREDLNCFEQARALEALLKEWRFTQEEAAKKLGVAQSTIANKIRLLRLDESVQAMINDNGLTERHARALLKIKTDETRRIAVKKIVDGRLNVAQTEQLVANMINGQVVSVGKNARLVVKDVRLFVNTINKAIATMKKAGIPARAQKVEQGDYVEYVVRIPNNF